MANPSTSPNSAECPVINRTPCDLRPRRQTGGLETVVPLTGDRGLNPSSGESARADLLEGPGRAIVFNRRTPAMAAGLLPV